MTPSPIRTRARRQARPARPRVEPLEGRVVPATIIVTTAADSGPGSLRAAITQADADGTQDTIAFAPSVRGTITLLSALPDLSGKLILDGPGARVLTVARSAAVGTPAFRIFAVPAGAEVTISGLTIAGGSAGSGGGISNSGTLTVVDSILSGNSTGEGGRGGGIDNSGRLAVIDSTLIGNNAIQAIITFPPPFHGGEVLPGFGGGIANRGMLTITDSTLFGNGAVQGGGIDNSGTLTITDSTLSGNEAGEGGGIANRGTLTITDSTLSGDSAATGGGIANLAEGGATFTASIFNASGGGSFFQGGAATSGGHNLFSDAPVLPLRTTDRINTDPRLGPLADNGGPTFTHALLPGSPAIDAGITAPGVTSDQRGVPRPQGAAPDIGAFEVRVMIGLSPASAASTVGQPYTVTATVADENGSPRVGLPVTFRVAAGPNAGASGITDPPDGRTDAAGQVRFTYSGNGGAGADTILASAQFPGGVTTVAPPALKTWTPASLTVTGLVRLGIHRQPTLLVLAFSAPLDPAPAQDTANYRLMVRGGHHPIRIRSAALSPDGRVVTLQPARRLPLKFQYQLTVVGTPPSGLTDTRGQFLSGAGPGRPGTDFTAVITREDLVLPPQQPPQAHAARHVSAGRSVPHGPAASRHPAR